MTKGSKLNLRKP